MVDTCACGDAVTKGGTRCDRCAALHVLGLEYGASNDEIKDALRILAKVWHPDRFESDKKLRTIAEEKVKEFNSAFQLLTMPSSRRVPRRPSQGRSPSQPKPPEPQTEQSQPKPQEQKPRTEWQSAAGAPKPPTSENRSQQNSTPTQRKRNHSRPARVPAEKLGWGFLGIIAAVMLIWVGGYLWHEKSRTRSISSRPAAPVVGGSPAQPPPVAQQPHDDPLTKTLPQPPPYGERQGQKTAPNTKSPEPLLKPRPPVIDEARYLTVGSTIDEVLAVQGIPTEVSGNVFHYGPSKVYFRNDVVESWEVSPLSPLKVRLLPSIPTSRQGYFTVGSTKDEVLAVQGTPTEFSEDVFHYGSSKVYFRSGVVESWDVWPLNPLKVRLLPSATTAGQGYFTFGSTKDEVLAVQGTPTKFSENFFYYGTSKVYFRNGVVESWDVWPLNPLKVRVLPK